MPRSKTSKAWLREHINDPWVQKAKAEGYRSRAAFKLKQIDAKDRLLKPGMVVVDLGSTPGGWSQVAGKAVGRAGKVVAVDLLEMEPLHGVVFLRGDFFEDATWRALETELDGRRADIVLSDMAPNLSGVNVADQARSVGLAELALDAAERLLAPGGAFLVKIFHGAGFEAYVKALRERFVQVVVRKPEASRGRSAETYLLARGFRGGQGTNQA
jgi:23S rRNA (uridine2552-2'-O)-methyltransferase